MVKSIQRIIKVKSLRSREAAAQSGDASFILKVAPFILKVCDPEVFYSTLAATCLHVNEEAAQVTLLL